MDANETVATIGARNLAETKNTTTKGDVRLSERFAEDNSDRDRDCSYNSLSPSDYYKNGKIYSYDFLVAQTDMSMVELPKTGTLTNEKGKIDDSKVLSLAIKNALSEGTKKGDKVYVKNAYTGRELRVDNSTIKHGLDGTYNRHITNARIGSVIGTVVKNAIPINGLKNTSTNAVGTYAMVSYCYDNLNREFIAVITVEQHSGYIDSFELYDVAHAVSGRQKKSSQVDTKSQGVNPIKAATISISNLLQIVNSTHQSILSEDVLKHLGEQRNSKGSYSDKVLFSDRDAEDVSNRSLLANALSSTAKNADEKQRLLEYKSNIRMLDAEQDKLQNLNKQIKELSFSKGARDATKLDELNSDNTIRRAYNVNDIKISPVAVSQVYKPADTTDDNGEFLSTISVSNLHAIVKQYDKSFSPKAVEKHLVNEDGSPKKILSRHK